MFFAHRRLLQFLITICIAGLLCPVITIGQEVITTQKLREQIAVMERVDSDPNTSDEVKTLNRSLLAERRAKLAARLVTEIASVKEYAETMSGTLSESEHQRVDSLVGSLQRELDSLRKTGTALATGDSPPASAPAQGPSTLNNPESNTALRRGTSNHPVTPANEVALPSNQVFVASCFTDAPNALTNTARAAAELFITDDDPTSQFGDLTFFAVTHAVAVQAGRDDLLKAIQVKQLQEQTRRTDKQIGASAKAAGSTSALEKPGFAEILGFAVEHGGIQQTVNGTTLNLSTTPYAFTTLNGGDTQSNYKKYGYLTRLGVSADFNIQNQDALLANARRSQLADWSVRLRLSNDRSTRSDDVEEIWNSISGEFARPSLVITDMLRATFQTDVELEAQRRDVRARLQALLTEPSVIAIRDNAALTQNQKINQIAEKIVCRIKADLVDAISTGTFKINQDSKDRIIRVTLPSYASAQEAKANALKEFDRRVDALSLKPVFSFAYSNVRPPAGTNYSELKMLYQKKTGDPVSVIANGGISFYHKANTALRQETVRDFAFALSLEGRAGRSPFLIEGKDESQVTYSFTGRYERLLENRLFPNRKADIAVAQFKLNIPMFAGTSFPFSVTYANATELVKEKHVRTNFGFTFDADKLLKAIALSKLSNP